MNGKVAGGLIIGLLLGIGIASLHRPAEVHAQKPQEVAVWEYNAVAFVPIVAGGYTGGHTKQVNKLAADGWQYVDPLSLHVKQREVSISTVLFKRRMR